MKIHLLPALAFSLILSSAVLTAQENDNSNTADQMLTTDKAFWQASVNGGTIMVALNAITSVSRHNYVLDGTLLVDEVTIDTLGQALTRFYFISPITQAVPNSTATLLADRGAQLLDQAGQLTGVDVQNKVVKKYPETTHAKTIEYRILSAEELTRLYDHLRKAWESGRGSQFPAK
jgi:hypothetical protein